MFLMGIAVVIVSTFLFLAFFTEAVKEIGLTENEFCATTFDTSMKMWIKYAKVAQSNDRQWEPPNIDYIISSSEYFEEFRNTDCRFSVNDWAYLSEYQNNIWRVQWPDMTRFPEVLDAEELESELLCMGGRGFIVNDKCERIGKYDPVTGLSIVENKEQCDLLEGNWNEEQNTCESKYGRYEKYLDENNELNFGLQYDKNGMIIDDLQRIFDWCDYSGDKPAHWYFDWNNQTHHIDSTNCQWEQTWDGHSQPFGKQNEN